MGVYEGAQLKVVKVKVKVKFALEQAMKAQRAGGISLFFI
jgi:hypothetical protein